jgi:hypothetical protein
MSAAPMILSGSGLGLIGLFLVTLKICDVPYVSECSWWLITLPFWFPSALGVALLASVFLFFASLFLLGKLLR